MTTGSHDPRHRFPGVGPTVRPLTNVGLMEACRRLSLPHATPIDGKPFMRVSAD